jgi:hypothetical protein
VVVAAATSAAIADAMGRLHRKLLAA